MTLGIYNTIDILIFSGILLLILIVHSYINSDSLSLSARYRTKLAFSILAILLCDTAARFSFPVGSDAARFLKFGLVFCYMLLQPLPVSLGLMYLFSLFREKRFSPAVHLLFLIPFFAGCAVMIYSLFTGYIFHIDEANVYHRGPGMFIFAIINYSYILPALALVCYYRDVIKRQTLLIVLAYTLIPCTGSLLQLLFYGVMTAWPSFAVAMLIIYIFLESRQSDRDYLTGLFNRQSFDVKVYARIEQYARKGAFSLAVIDLDKFKKINDTYGHDKGDEVLQAAAIILSHSVSAVDTVARYGGDEFVIIIETANRQIVENVLARIDRNIAAWNEKNESPFCLSVSAGYEVFDPARHRDYDELFQKADIMMFKKKREKAQTSDPIPGSPASSCNRSDAP